MSDDIIDTEEEMTNIVIDDYLFEPVDSVRKLSWIHAFKELPNRGCKFWTLGGMYGPSFFIWINSKPTSIDDFFK